MLRTQKHRQIRRLGEPNPMDDVPDQDSAKVLEKNKSLFCLPEQDRELGLTCSTPAPSSQHASLNNRNRHPADTTLELFFGRGVPKSIFARSGSKSVFRTHKYHQNAQNFETNPMGPVPGSETQISREKSFNFLIGVRILLGL